MPPVKLVEARGGRGRAAAARVRRTHGVWRCLGRRAIAVAFLLAAIVVTAAPGPAAGRDVRVSSDAELSSALRSARSGDTISLAPGTYKGDLYAEGLEGVTIRSADAANRAVIEGGTRGMQLIAPVDLTIASLVFSRPLGHGLMIDDASRGRPARRIKIENVAVRNVVEPGNNDGIKLAGVEDVHIRNAVVEGWGTEGSGIDFVGVHRALIEGSLLRHPGIGNGGTGIRVKGGSKAITIRANRVELAAGKGRGIQAGGHTSAELFRFVDGDRGYEASEVLIEGNVVIGGGAALAWVNIDGGVAHRNLVLRPGTWVMRILNESSGLPIVATRNGWFHDNRVVIDSADRGFNRTVNIGDGTHPETFTFARNTWLDLGNPTPEGSRPRLPAEERDGVHGASPPPNADWAQIWEMPWGWWVVNATTTRATLDIGSVPGARIASPGPSGQLLPLAASPLVGQWTLSDPGARLTLEPMSQAVLIRN